LYVSTKIIFITCQAARHGCIQGGHLEQSEGLNNVCLGGKRLQLHLGQRLGNADDGLQLSVARREIKLAGLVREYGGVVVPDSDWDAHPLFRLPLVLFGAVSHNYIAVFQLIPSGL